MPDGKAGIVRTASRSQRAGGALRAGICSTKSGINVVGDFPEQGAVLELFRPRMRNVHCEL
jgi:hypothetical protein